MSQVLIDTSIWVEYFRNTEGHKVLDELIVDNLACTNDLILAELIPAIRVRDERELIDSLLSINRYDIRIDWNQIVQMQVTNIENGLNRVGIPDLIILENAIAHDLTLFSRDKHFVLMQHSFSFRLFDEQRDESNHQD